MSIHVSVGLLSGKTALVEARIEEDVDALKIRAQRALGVGFGMLVDAAGSILQESLPIRRAKVQNRDSLTLQMRSVEACASGWAFATIFGDGYVASWGKFNERHGNCFRGPVQQIHSTGYAFAAILDDETVVTWGDAGFGGDSCAVQHQLTSVKQIQANCFAFAFVLANL